MRLDLERFFLRVADFASDAIVITEAEPMRPPGPRIVWCNSAFTKMTGYTLDEVRGLSPRILQGPETDRAAIAALGRALARWETARAELKNYAKDRTPFWVEMEIAPIRDCDGWPAYWVAIQRDVTRRKQAETTLRERYAAVYAAQERLQRERAEVEGVAAIARHSRDMITITDLDFRIRWANVAFLDKVGLGFTDVLGRSHCDLLDKHSGPYRSREAAAKAFLSGVCVAEETVNTTPKGEKFWTDLTVSVQRDDDGEPTGFVTVERDVTEQRRMREELRRHRDHLQQLVEERTLTIRANTKAVERALETQKRLNEQQIQFIRMASHEFRTPMAVISMAARQLKRRVTDDETAREKLATIDAQIARLGKLIDGTLMLAKADAGKFEFQVEPVAVRDYLAERLEEWRMTARRHEIRLSDSAGAATPWIHADRKLMDHVFDNLVGNAIKYSPEADAIDVTLSADEDAVSLAVRDYGVGVPKDEVDKLGDRYFRASTSSGIAGTGIGLSVVREFVDLHGGRLFVESEEGRGSTFTVSLPRIAPPAPTEAAAEEETAA